MRKVSAKLFRAVGPAPRGSVPPEQRAAVKSAVRRSLGTKAVSITRTPDGHNSSWFAVAGGDAIVVKATPLAAFEAWACTAARERGVPAPEVLGLDAGAPAPFPDGCIVMRRLPGSPLSEVQLSETARTTALRQAGEILRHVHEVMGAGFGRPNPVEHGGFGGCHPSWPEAVRDWTGRLLDTVVPDALAPAAADLVRSTIDRHDDVFARCRTSTLVHGDFKPRHVLVSEPTGRVEGIADFGGALFGAPAYDLAVFWLAESRDVALLIDGYEPDLARRLALIDEARVYRLVRRVARLAWAKMEGADPAPRRHGLEAEMRDLGIVGAAG